MGGSEVEDADGLPPLAAGKMAKIITGNSIKVGSYANYKTR